MEKEKGSGISRRDFLKGTAAGGVGIAGASVLTACSPDRSEAAAETAGVTAAAAPRESLMKKVKETIKADVVVLGSGGSLPRTFKIDNDPNIAYVDVDSEEMYLDYSLAWLKETENSSVRRFCSIIDENLRSLE